jgi:hypothetical protein
VNIDLWQNGRAANAKPSAARGNILREILKLIVGRNSVSTSAIVLQLNCKTWTTSSAIFVFYENRKTLEENC